MADWEPGLPAADSSAGKLAYSAQRREMADYFALHSVCDCESVRSIVFIEALSRATLHSFTEHSSAC